MIVMRTWTITIITPTSACDLPCISYIEIKRDVGHHLQCEGYYDDSYQGTARHEDVALRIVMMWMTTIITPRRR